MTHRMYLQEAVTGNFTELSKLLADRGAKVAENGKVEHIFSFNIASLSLIITLLYVRSKQQGARN